MSRSHLSLPATRREFLARSAKGLGLIALAPVAPRFLTQSVLAGAPPPEKDRTILVLIQLAGGNDGLNTLIPYQDDHYYRLRPNLAIRDPQRIPLSDELALHPACTELARLYDSGNLTLIQNVGYPNPNRSHFRSTEIWETASDSDQSLSSGWIGRFFDNTCSGAPEPDPRGIHVGTPTPPTLIGDAQHSLFGLENRRSFQNSSDPQRDLLSSLSQSNPLNETHRFLQHTSMNALVTEDRIHKLLRRYRPATNYPHTPLARNLQQIAAMIAAGLSTRVYFTTHSGYDTHARQLNLHAALLKQFSQAIAAFQKDLHALRLQNQVLTLVFSEFGRRPAENRSRGTDHGTAAPLFLFGNQIQPGIFGSSPSLQLQQQQDLPFQIDFRQVYASILQNWFHTPPLPVLGQPFQTLPILHPFT